MKQQEISPQEPVTAAMLQTIQAVQELTGLTVTWKDSSREAAGLILPECYLHQHPLCLKQKSVPNSLIRCIHDDNRCFLGQSATDSPRPFCKRCHAGVRELVTLLCDREGKIHGAFYVGPFLIQGRDQPDTMQTQMGVPLISEERYQHIRDLLAPIAVYFTELESRSRQACDHIRDTRIRRVLRYIRHHYHESITLNTLAQEACLSVSRLQHLFRSQVHMSIRDWIVRVRMEEACTHLKRTDLPIGDIAGQVGYLSQAAFTAAFRRYTGVTPRDWRDRHRTGDV